ncbi:SDR family oxidoreductase [Methanoculleus sp. FWC-SCC3]|uniref:SDR family oxidoreductase n=1 Tax=Methanoculleus methanifontis TaxID=2584086 RepID=A0ABT8M404_9EURY|nr:SDR family oxidoreductase [Methanoculleus sp. FWC-SCC3]MDN7012963.1 SDR family oxidoreductase [Methanoculleus sp. FWC-SCC3]
MMLENKVAIVTGASSGMGAAIAKRFAKEGASIVALARRKERLQTLIDEIAADGGRAIAVAGDVTRDGDVENVVKTAVREFGKLDVVVNNAGLLDRFVPVAELDSDLWNAVIEVNLTGPMRMFRAAIPEMVKVGGGAFVTIASIGGLHGCRAGAAYTASKHGVIGLAKNVAYMYAVKGIRSNVIAPGGVKTEIGAGQEANEGGAAVCMAGMGINPRMGEAEEIASVALFLASDEASFVNGATVVADAGWTAY